MSNRGVLIALEGPEGAGKSTQAPRIAAALTERGLSPLVTREPGGTAVGEAIRQMLLDQSDYAILPETEALLYAAARSQHVREVLSPAIAAGSVVICDRFIDSTLAYQGGGRGLDRDQLMRLHSIAADGMEPDLCVLFDLPIQVGLNRRFSEGGSVNRLDAAGEAFHQRVRSVYLRLAAENPSHWLTIDAGAKMQQVTSEAVHGILARLSTRLDALMMTRDTAERRALDP